MAAPTIAILDNDPSSLSLMHDLLADEGYAPLLWPASEGVRAHALLRRLRPDLVILDLWLEERDDGWPFLTRLWGDAETTQIPVMVVTGEAVLSPRDAGRLRAMRCRVVKKPFDGEDLLDAIAAVLGPSPMQRRHGPRPYALPRAGPAMSDAADDPLATAAGEPV